MRGTGLLLVAAIAFVWALHATDASHEPRGVGILATISSNFARLAPQTVRPAALTVRVPRSRPGVPAPRARMNWAQLWRLAAPAARFG